jgi:hypothetical protein
MERPIGARDIVANLYDDDVEDMEESHEDVVDDLNYDVYNMVARNYHPILFDSNDDIEAVLQENFTRATQLLITR